MYSMALCCSKLSLSLTPNLTVLWAKGGPCGKVLENYLCLSDLVLNAKHVGCQPEWKQNPSRNPHSQRGQTAQVSSGARLPRMSSLPEIRGLTSTQLWSVTQPWISAYLDSPTESLSSPNLCLSLLASRLPFPAVEVESGFPSKSVWIYQRGCLLPCSLTHGSWKSVWDSSCLPGELCTQRAGCTGLQYGRL